MFALIATEPPNGASALAENAKLRGDLQQAYQQLNYLWETTHSCPCGARLNSLHTHSHVGDCPTEAAAIWWAEAAALSERSTSPAEEQS